MELGLGSMPRLLQTETVVSVCPNPSISLMPVALYQLLKTSGLRASPAIQQYLREERSCCSSPALMNILNMVGGQQRVVILCFSTMWRISWGSNLS